MATSAWNATVVFRTLFSSARSLVRYSHKLIILQTKLLASFNLLFYYNIINDSMWLQIHHLVTSKSGIVNKSTVSLLFDRATSVRSSEIEDAAGQMTPASLLDFPASSLRAYACTAAVDQPVAGKKKKRRVLLNPSRQRCSATNRRKSVPNRAPLNWLCYE